MTTASQVGAAEAMQLIAIGHGSWPSPLFTLRTAHV